MQNKFKQISYVTLMLTENSIERYSYKGFFGRHDNLTYTEVVPKSPTKCVATFLRNAQSMVIPSPNPH